MNQIEYLRKKLHNVLELGDIELILQVSRELDEVIYKFMENQMDISKV